jgi:hypothetical protein
MIIKGGIPGVIAKPGPGLGHGITPAQVASGGAFASPLANDFDPGDDLTQLLWVLLPPLVPTGTTQVNDLGRYWLLSPAQGTWVQLYRVLAMPATGAPVVQEAAIFTTVGPMVAGAARRVVINRSTSRRPASLARS